MSGYLYIGDPFNPAIPRIHVKTIKDEGNGFVTLRTDDGGDFYLNNGGGIYNNIGKRNAATGFGPWEQFKVQGSAVISWNGYVYYLARLA